MHVLKFTYNGQNYRLDMGTQTLTNMSTGEACKVHQLRDFGLIAAVHQVLADAERGKVYELILERMLHNLERLNG